MDVIARGLLLSGCCPSTTVLGGNIEIDWRGELETKKDRTSVSRFDPLVFKVDGYFLSFAIPALVAIRFFLQAYTPVPRVPTPMSAQVVGSGTAARV